MTPSRSLPRKRADAGRRGLVLLLLTVLLPACGHAAPAALPPTATNWQAAGNVEFPPGTLAAEPGAELRINGGQVELRGAPFADGTIEFDESDLFTTGGMDFPSVRFRAHGADNGEQVYLRPGPDCTRADDCIQYAPILHGCLLWDVYPQYQAGGPVQATGWNHVRLVFAGRRLRVFVNGAAEPSLSVDELEAEPEAGAVQLSGPALYRNVSVSPNVATDLASAAEPLPRPDPGLVRAWSVAPPVVASPGAMPSYADHPPANAGWSAITAERSGLVNIGRRYGPPQRGVGSTAWLRTTIRSDRARNELVSLGWTRSATVFVNGRQVFSGRNFYYGLDADRRPPDGRLSLRNATVPIALRQGRNEIVVAVNDFFPGSAIHAGWGLALQMHDLDGIALDE